MKKLFLSLLIAFVPSSIFGIGGFGLQLGQGAFRVDASSPETGSSLVTLMNGAFDGSFGVGGYVYIDLIPFVDIEFEANAHGNLYDIEFQNAFGEMPPLEFAWASKNTYSTIRKKVIGLSIPFLAGAQLHAGGGFNTHKTVPVASVETVTNLLGGDLLNADPSNLKNNLKNFLEDDENLVDAKGFHIQTGLQFKLLMVDTFLIYRHTFADKVIPGSSSFGKLSVRLGLGI